MGETRNLDVRLPVDTATKRFYILKTNGVANIRSINLALHAIPEVPTFWLAGYLAPRKLRTTTVLRKQFLFYDYAFVELADPYRFETFLLERKIAAYFLHIPGTKTPVSLSDEEVQRIKRLEAFKQLEAENLQEPSIKIGSQIEVCNGPFIGCKGTVLELREHVAVLEMDVFDRPTRVNVSYNFLDNVLSTYETGVFPSDEA